MIYPLCLILQTLFLAYLAKQSSHRAGNTKCPLTSNCRER